MTYEQKPSEKRTFTIKLVKDEIRSFDGSKGKVWVPAAMTDSGDKLEKFCDSEAEAKSTQEAFRGLIGKPGEFEVTVGKLYEGIQAYNVRKYPGGPQKAYGGGGKSFTPSWAQTREGQTFITGSITAQQALKCATEMASGVGTGDIDIVLGNAAKMLDFLKSNTPAPQEAPKAPEAAPAPSTNGTPAKPLADRVNLCMGKLGSCNTIDDVRATRKAATQLLIDVKGTPFEAQLDQRFRDVENTIMLYL